MNSLTDPFPTLDQLPHPAAPPAPAAPAIDHDAVALGYEEGLRRGYEEGSRRAAEDARSDLSYALTALHTAIEDLHRRDAASVDDVSGEVVDVAMAVAEIILGREIDAAIDPAATRSSGRWPSPPTVAPPSHASTRSTSSGSATSPP